MHVSLPFHLVPNYTAWYHKHMYTSCVRESNPTPLDIVQYKLGVVSVQWSARPSITVPHRPMCTCVRRLSMAASSIRYYTRRLFVDPRCRLSTLGSGRPVALELLARQLGREGQLQTSAEDAFIYTILKHLA